MAACGLAKALSGGRPLLDVSVTCTRHAIRHAIPLRSICSRELITDAAEGNDSPASFPVYLLQQVRAVCVRSQPVTAKVLVHSHMAYDAGPAMSNLILD